MAMILSAFVTNFMSTLSQMAQDEVGQLLGVPGEIEKLTRMVYRVERVLVDAERKQNESETINLWLKDLKDIMYDADDVIDLCRMKADERRAQPGSSSFSKTSCGIHFLSCFRNPVFAHQIARKIDELNCRMFEIDRHIGLLGLIENRGISGEARQMASSISRKTHPLVVLSDIVGEKIVMDAETIVNFLREDVTHAQGNIPIVAIEGMGGIGKTTLAKMVYNDGRIELHFEQLIWICVSKELRPVDIVQNVIREIGGDYGVAKEISELMSKLQQYVQRKKFLLVLDDIWPESEKVWSDLLRYPMSKGALGSRVLITTRDGGVACRMGAVRSHKVERLLTKDGCSLLFKQIVRNEVESDPNFKNIGMEIVQRCDGLPLAIKSIGGMLCMKGKTRSNLEAVLRSDVWATVGLPDNVHRAFYLSYGDLPPPLKQCFIFCSLFPEEFVFRKTDLIYMWLAEGFLQDKENFWELGNNYYTELLLRNLLEETEELYYQEQCKMHDLLWSFAHQLGKDENCVLRERQVLSRPNGSQKVRRLSIEGKDVNTEVIKNEKGLRTLLLQFKPSIDIALDNMCKAFSSLRILDLSYSKFEILSDSLCDLVHLRYLDVRGSQIRYLPNSIGNLTNLVYFCCSNCKELLHVPQSITNLRELRFLSFHETKVDAIPKGLENLKLLIELCSFKPSQNEGFSSLDELGALSQLVTLQVACLEKVSDISIAEKANLQSKHLLHNLYLKYTSLIWEDQVSLTNEKKMTTEGVLNELSPPRNLEILKIEGYFGSYLPKWFNLGANLPYLRFLHIINCACIEGLAPLGQLPNLNILQIIGVYSVVNVGEEFMLGDTKGKDLTIHAMGCSAKPAFPKLSQLEFERMSNWEEWKWNNRQPAMPKLKKLFIRACPQLRSLPEGLSHYATSLEYLKIDGVDKLITIQNLPSIKDIRVFENPNLVQISGHPSIGGILFPGIQYIQIYNCPKLKLVAYPISTITLVDYKMETLPEYLMTTMPDILIIRCSDDLLHQIATQRERGSEWHKFSHIRTVKFYSLSETFCATYQETPFSFTYLPEDTTG